MNDLGLRKKRLMLSVKTEYGFMTVFASIMISIIPVISPYSIGRIPVVVLLGFLFILLCICKQGSFKIKITKTYTSLFALVISIILMSINGFLILDNTSMLINSVVLLVYNVILFTSLFDYSDVQLTVKMCTIVGIFACCFAAFQFFMKVLGNTVPMGQLPFFSISSGWVSEIWGYRFNSIFSEPSFFAMYLLPLFAYYLFDSNWVKTGIFAFFMILSSSSLGIIIMIAVVIYYVFFVKGGLKKRLNLIIMLTITFAIIVLLFSFIPELNKLFLATQGKIGEIASGEGDSLRLGGYASFFDIYPFKEKMFGIGLNQFQNYMKQLGFNVKNYSNAFVIMILTTGVIGFLSLVLYILDLFRISIRNRNTVFFVVLVLVMASDYVLLNYRFFYLVFFVYHIKYCNYIENHKKSQRFISNSVYHMKM